MEISINFLYFCQEIKNGQKKMSKFKKIGKYKIEKFSIFCNNVKILYLFIYIINDLCAYIIYFITYIIHENI